MLDVYILTKFWRGLFPSLISRISHEILVSIWFSVGRISLFDVCIFLDLPLIITDPSQGPCHFLQFGSKYVSVS